jgi:hypothetical protein
MTAPKTYKRSVIATLPLLEQLIFEAGAREGLVEIIDDLATTAGPAPQGARA